MVATTIGKIQLIPILAIKRKSNANPIRASLGTFAALIQVTLAGDVIKANNTDALNLATSWTTVAPASTDLAVWTPSTPDGTTTDSGSPIETVTVDVPNALLGNPKLFVRVLAQ